MPAVARAGPSEARARAQAGKCRWPWSRGSMWPCRGAGRGTEGGPMPAGDLSPRPLGSSGLDVSALSLGSWRTFEAPAARDRGRHPAGRRRRGASASSTTPATTTRRARPPSRPGTRRCCSGSCSAGGLRRDETVVANKLWWEFWPEQSAAAELDGSLQRMGFGHVDLIYANPPPAGLEVADLVADVGALVAAGKARAWGLVNWPAESVRPGGRGGRRPLRSHRPARSSCPTAWCSGPGSRTPP
jgi:hypothetical protein